MSQLTVVECRDKKAELECAIGKLCDAFFVETGMAVTGLEIDYNQWGLRESIDGHWFFPYRITATVEL